MWRNGWTRTLLKYLLVQVPGWTIAIVLAWMLHRLYALPWWAGLLLVGLWIAKDLALYPSMRPFYETSPAEPRIVGDAGIAVTDLAPRGFVRVYGELWQAEAVGGAHIPDGFTVCVRDIRGLLLIVEPVPAAVHERDIAERPSSGTPGCGRRSEGVAVLSGHDAGARLMTSNHPQSHSHREIQVTPGECWPGAP